MIPVNITLFKLNNLCCHWNHLCKLSFITHKQNKCLLCFFFPHLQWKLIESLREIGPVFANNSQAYLKDSEETKNQQPKYSKALKANPVWPKQCYVLSSGNRASSPSMHLHRLGSPPNSDYEFKESVRTLVTFWINPLLNSTEGNRDTVEKEVGYETAKHDNVRTSLCWNLSNGSNLPFHVLSFVYTHTQVINDAVTFWSQLESWLENVMSIDVT